MSVLNTLHIYKQNVKMWIFLLRQYYVYESFVTEKAQKYAISEYKMRKKAVMSTSVWIFEYLNKMALKYYLHSYLCHFPSTNTFEYSFVGFWTTECIWIFIRKFFKIRIYLNICSEPYFNVSLSILNQKIIFNRSWPQKISVLPRQFHRHIDLVVDFINLCLAKWLRPQDAVRALYVGLICTLTWGKAGRGK